MGKIVKYCAACDESFAEKFAFCPNCGQAMTAFEMNPLVKEAPVSEQTAAPVSVVEDSTIQTSAPDSFETASIVETVPFAETPSVAEVNTASANQTQSFLDELSGEDFEQKNAEMQPEVEAPVTKTFAAAAGAGTNGNHNRITDQSYRMTSSAPVKGDFHVTVIEEKNTKQRNLLLLGSMALMMTLTLGGTVYSLFNKNLLVGAIGEEYGIMVPVVDEAPMEIEEKEQPKKEDKGGGGGGGGRDKPTPTSQGQLATQTEKPMIAPTVTLVKKDFELKYQASTQGRNVIKQTDQPYGDPNSRYTLSSDGMGTGGGQGSGIGTGQGSGRGTGQGSGIGSGSGSGVGNGNGSGTGDGNNSPRTPPPPPPAPKPPVEVVSEPFKIISKPRPGYTDAARQNQVTGVVRLRVTFSASGSIGSIAPVSGLPYGLTEQAIAAARQIKFEPAKKNGVPQSVSKIIEYSFSIY